MRAELIVGGRVEAGRSWWEVYGTPWGVECRCKTESVMERGVLQMKSALGFSLSEGKENNAAEHFQPQEFRGC